MKVLKNIFFGVLFSVFIYNVAGLFFVDDQIRTTIIATMIMGGVIGGLSFLYETDLPLLVASIIQTVGSLATFLTVAYLCQWFPFRWNIIISSSLIFLAIFFSIWTIFYLQEKKKVASINQQLK